MQNVKGIKMDSPEETGLGERNASVKGNFQAEFNGSDPFNLDKQSEIGRLVRDTLQSVIG
jgi:hypothetical protein